jgi:hypothetical protein
MMRRARDPYLRALAPTQRMPLMRMPKTAAGQAGSPGSGPATAGSAEAAALPGRLRGHARQLPALARRNWLFTVLLAAGLVLRVLAQITYRPALLYIDTLKYLYNAWPGTDPLGYKGVLKAILLVGNLQWVTAIQHLVGLGMGVAIYAVLRRRGVPRWLAALAAAPVLLDAYELQNEQTIMPDVWFDALMVVALVVLLWQPRPTRRAIAAAGIALGLSVTIGQATEILILPAVIYLAVAVGGWWHKVRAVALMCVAFVLPILLYMSLSAAFNGHFWLSRAGTSQLYGRAAEAADCATLRIPAYERPLCPTAKQKALGADSLDHQASSPLQLYVAPVGMDQSKVISSFIKAVMVQQPLRVVEGTFTDAARLFTVNRVTIPGDTPISRWQFQTSYPSYQNYVRTNAQNVIILGLKVQNPPPNYVYVPLNPAYGGKASVIRPLADFLHAYQLDGGYTPGPLYLAATVLGLIGTLSLIRRKRRSAIAADHQLALACCLFFLSAAAILLFSDFTEFSWRYQLPAIMTLPPAGALGLAVILTKISSRRKPAAAASGPADTTANAADSTASMADSTGNTANSTMSTAADTANAGDGTANSADSAVAADTRPPTMRTAPDDSAPEEAAPGTAPGRATPTR